MQAVTLLSQGNDSMATIRKRGNRWQVQVRRIGFPPMSKSFLKRGDALEWARHAELAVDRKDLPQRAAPDIEEKTLDELLEKYINEVVSKKKSAPAQSIILNAFRRDPICKKPALTLRSQDFIPYKEARLTEVSPTTFNHQIAIVQHAFEVAIREWHWPFKENPLKRLKKPRNNKGRERRLEGIEEKLLLLHTEQTRNPHVKNVILFALETAMRRGEILRIDWKDVNLSKKTLHIPITKNGSPRTVPLTPRALELLVQVEKREGKLFPLSEEALKLAWKRLVNRAGIQDLHFHDLRHEAISRLIERGFSLAEVALVSGHKDPRMLFRYTHLRVEDLVNKMHS